MKNRLLRLFILLVIIALGLGSRKYGALLPDFIAEYSGDTLWAVAVYLTAGLINPKINIVKCAVISLTIAYLVEISQLYHSAWADAVRTTLPGKLLLGQGFLWSDLVCYTVGIGLAVLIEMRISRKNK